MSALGPSRNGARAMAKERNVELTLTNGRDMFTVSMTIRAKHAVLRQYDDATMYALGRHDEQGLDDFGIIYDFGAYVALQAYANLMIEGVSGVDMRKEWSNFGGTT